MDIIITDLNFFAPQVIGSYIIETDDGPVVIETGPDTTFDNLKEGLKKNGYEVGDVKHVFVTHIHLDHSGAAWHFAKDGATIYVHERGAPHLVNPERLMKSAAMIYGDRMEELWGEVQGIDENLVKVIKDGEKLNIGGLKIEVVESIGHANHHNAYLIDGNLFTGDVAGCRIAGGPVIPPTPPPDIHVERWHTSVDKIKEIGPEKLFLTHFGEYTEVENHLDKLMDNLDKWSEWMGERVKAGKTEEEITPEFETFYKGFFKEVGASEKVYEQYEFADPYWMNVGGLIRYWNKYVLSDK